MTIRSTAALLRLLLASIMLLASVAVSAADASVEEAMSYDGLQKISVKGIDLAYARPGAQLSTYRRVMIDPVEVSFSRYPRRPGSRLPISQADRDRIRTGVANIVHEEFVRELQSNNYQIVTEPGPDVLRVRANVINLIVNAPDSGTARTSTFVVSAGEMTLVAELFDSESGEVEARLVDRRQARSTGRLQLSGAMQNADEARTIAAAWARILRTALDRAHGVGGK
jgi:hypothetical protein